MIDLQQWRASIGLNNARGRRASRRNVIASTKQGIAPLLHNNTAGLDHKRVLAVALCIFAAIIIIECTSNIHTSLTGAEKCSSYEKKMGQVDAVANMDMFTISTLIRMFAVSIFDCILARSATYTKKDKGTTANHSCLKPRHSLFFSTKIGVSLFIIVAIMSLSFCLANFRQLLLLIAGDVERNPGPPPIPTLAELEALPLADEKSYDFGLALGLDLTLLNEIKKNATTMAECKMHIFHALLEQSPKPLWCNVKDSLYKIGASETAEFVASTYCHEECRVNRGGPLQAAVIDEVDGLEIGDHILFQVIQEPYRPGYESALVSNVDAVHGQLTLIRNTRLRTLSEVEVVVDYSKLRCVHKVEYTPCLYSADEAIQRAKQRFEKEDSVLKPVNCYHALNNNSHQFVTWCKTGLEYSLSNIILHLDNTKTQECAYDISPILTEVSIEVLSAVFPGDHLVVNHLKFRQHHWIVESIDIHKQTWTGYRCRGGKIIMNEHKWKPCGRIKYDDAAAKLLSPEKTIEMVKADYDRQQNSSDKLIANLKTGHMQSIKLASLDEETDDTDESITLKKDENPDTPLEVTKCQLSTIECIKPGHHIVLNNKHILVESVEEKKKGVIAYSYEKGKICRKPTPISFSWGPVFLIKYPEQRSAQESISAAWSLYQCSFLSCDEYATNMKTGQKYAVDDCCIFTSKSSIVGFTKLTPSSTIGPGDHLVVKAADQTTLHSVLVTGCSIGDGIVVMPNFNISTKVFDVLDLESSELEFFLVNYSGALPSKSVLQRAIGTNGRQMLEKFQHDSHKFVTWAKTGNQMSVDLTVTTEESDIAGYTKIFPADMDTSIQVGDHLLVKTSDFPFRSTLVVSLDSGGLVIMPDLLSDELHGVLDVDDNIEEIYRINYSQTLSPVDVIKRANCETGIEVLKQCRTEVHKFVSWAKCGKKIEFDIDMLVLQVRDICPYECEIIHSVRDIHSGDHLIQSYLQEKYRSHFIVTDCSQASHNIFKAVWCHRIFNFKEEGFSIDLDKATIFRIIYPECYSDKETIARARSLVGHKNILGKRHRVWFARWVKTGSDGEIEVNFLTKRGLPHSKSRIRTITQLDRGDYLAVSESGSSCWHHCLVTEVHSPVECTVIESWGDTPGYEISEHRLTIPGEGVCYRINYQEDHCMSPDKSITRARNLISSKKSFKPGTYRTRQKLVNYAVTGIAEAIDIGMLPDDRLQLQRQQLDTTKFLKRGDHVERRVTGRIGTVTNAFHHMIVLEPLTDRRCKVLHYHVGISMKPITKGCVGEEEVDLFETKDLYQVIYPERIDPEYGIEELTKLATVKKPYNLFTSNCEHAVMKATIDDQISIQVNVIEHRALQVGKGAAVVGLSQILGPRTIIRGCSKGVSRLCLHAGAKASAKTAAKTAAKTGAKTSAKAASKVVGKGALKLGFKAATEGSAVGTLAGVAVGINLAFEGPLLVHGIYEAHRKRSFSQISEREYRRTLIEEWTTHGNAALGGIAGALIGQVAIPVPVVGAMIGGVGGSFIGQIAGAVEGKAIGALCYPEKISTLPVVEKHKFIRRDSSFPKKDEAECKL